MVTTKQKILEEALALFSKKGFEATSMQKIAQATGIKVPSLYKHYSSKQAIFDAILQEMNTRYKKQTSALTMDGENPEADEDLFKQVDESQLRAMAMSLFLFFLKDPFQAQFRRMLSIEQYQNSQLADLYSRLYYDGPLEYQSLIFKQLIEAGYLKQCDPKELALTFYAPIYTLLCLCDRQPQKEAEACRKIEGHIHLFIGCYQAKSGRQSSTDPGLSRGERVSTKDLIKTEGAEKKNENE